MSGLVYRTGPEDGGKFCGGALPSTVPGAKGRASAQCRGLGVPWAEGRRCVGPGSKCAEAAGACTQRATERASLNLEEAESKVRRCCLVLFMCMCCLGGPRVHPVHLCLIAAGCALLLAAATAEVPAVQEVPEENT